MKRCQCKHASEILFARKTWKFLLLLMRCIDTSLNSEIQEENQVIMMEKTAFLLFVLAPSSLDNESPAATFSLAGLN
jgi:hypothetical protein